MNISKKFPNLKLNKLKAHNSLNIIAAVGFRTCLILNTSLEVIQRHLDSNRNENFYACEFIETQSSNTSNASSTPNSITDTLNTLSNALSNGIKNCTDEIKDVILFFKTVYTI